MKKNINLKIEKKPALLLLAMIGCYSFADFVSLVNVKSSGGISIVSGVSQTDIDTELAALQSRIDDLIAGELPIGTIAIWGNSTLPEGWIELAGQSTSSYPKLNTLFGVNLPNMRGQFARGWDNGAGIDEESNRELLSSQDDQIQNITGAVTHLTSYANGYMTGSSYANGAILATNRYNTNTNYGATGTASDTTYHLNFDSSRVVNSGEETRPVNVALIYIVKAE